jgi:hypothetical protein
MADRVLLGYQPIAAAPPCPSCGERHYAVIDDGKLGTFKVLCWCGVTARVAKDDPDLVDLLANKEKP